MVEEKWLKILEGPGTITLGVRFLAEMESWILQVSVRTFSGTCCKQSCGAGVRAEGAVNKLLRTKGPALDSYFVCQKLKEILKNKVMVASVHVRKYLSLRT